MPTLHQRYGRQQQRIGPVGHHHQHAPNAKAPNSHKAAKTTKTTGTGISKNLPYASPMGCPEARARGRCRVPGEYVRGCWLLLLSAVDLRRR